MGDPSPGNMKINPAQVSKHANLCTESEQFRVKEETKAQSRLGKECNAVDGDDNSSFENHDMNQQTPNLLSSNDQLASKSKQVSFSVELATCKDSISANQAVVNSKNDDEYKNQCGDDENLKPKLSESVTQSGSIRFETPDISDTEPCSASRVGRRAGRGRRLRRRRSQTPFHRARFSAAQDEEKDNSCEENKPSDSRQVISRDESTSEKSVDRRKVRFSEEENTLEEDDTASREPIRKSSSTALHKSKSLLGKQGRMKCSREELVRRFMSAVTSDGDHDTDDSAGSEDESEQNLESVSYTMEPEIIDLSARNTSDKGEGIEKATSTSESVPLPTARGRRNAVSSKISRRDKTPFRRLSFSHHDADDGEIGSSQRARDAGASSQNEVDEFQIQPSSQEENASSSSRLHVSFSDHVSHDSPNHLSSRRGRQRDAVAKPTKRDQTPFNPRRFATLSSDEEDDDASASAKEQVVRSPGSTVRFVEQVECMDVEPQPTRLSRRSLMLSAGTQTSVDSRKKPMTPRQRIARRSPTPFSPRRNLADWSDSDDNDLSSAKQGTNIGNMDGSSAKLEESSEENKTSVNKFEKGTQTGMCTQVRTCHYGDWEEGDYELYKEKGGDNTEAAHTRQTWMPLVVWAAAHVVGIGLLNCLAP